MREIYTVKDSRIENQLGKWKFFLSLHGIALSDVFRIETGKFYMHISRFKNDQTGHRFLVDGDIAREEEMTVKMMTRPPQ